MLPFLMKLVKKNCTVSIQWSAEKSVLSIINESGILNYSVDPKLFSVSLQSSSYPGFTVQQNTDIDVNRTRESREFPLLFCAASYSLSVGSSHPKIIGLTVMVGLWIFVTGVELWYSRWVGFLVMSSICFSRCRSVIRRTTLLCVSLTIGSTRGL